MTQKPQIKPHLHLADKIIEVFASLILITTWTITFLHYSDLPESIPTHYNALGEADKFGSKQSILTFPLMSIVIFIGLTIFARFPHIFNYPIKITEENAPRQYANAVRLIRFLKLMLLIIFGLIQSRIIQHASGQASELGVWFLPLVMTLSFIPLMYFLIKSLRDNKNQKL